jgi:hypothetical protein
LSNYRRHVEAAPSTFSALSTFGDHLFGSRVYFCGPSTNSACAPSVSSSVGLGGRRFFYFLCIVRDPQQILGRPDRCSRSTESHRFVVVRFHGPHRCGMELSVPADNPVFVNAVSFDEWSCCSRSMVSASPWRTQCHSRHARIRRRLTCRLVAARLPRRHRGPRRNRSRAHRWFRSWCPATFRLR